MNQAERCDNQFFEGANLRPDEFSEEVCLIMADFLDEGGRITFQQLPQGVMRSMWIGSTWLN